MKKIVFLVLLILAVPVMCYAGVAVQDDGTYVGEATKINFTGTTVSFAGDTASVPCAEATIERNVPIEVGEFYVASADGAIAPITASTAPGLELDNEMIAIVWADGEVTAVQATFRIPSDYSSGGSFRVLVADSADSTANVVDWAVFINKDDTAWDTATSAQTTYALSNTIATHPEVLALALDATDAASMAAGSYVTFIMWRDDTLTGTADLELYSAEFVYTASQ